MVSTLAKILLIVVLAAPLSGCARKDDSGITIPGGQNSKGNGASSPGAGIGSGVLLVSSSHTRARRLSDDGIQEETTAKPIDREQQIEQVEPGLAGLFASSKASPVPRYEEECRLQFQLSWVIGSKRDTSPDSRHCDQICGTTD